MMFDFNLLDKIIIVLFVFFLVGGLLWFILSLCKNKNINSWGNKLAKMVIDRKFVFLVLILVIFGLFFHFVEVSYVKYSSNGENQYGHGVSSSVTITLIGVFIGIVTIIGLFHTINEIKDSIDPKIVDYDVFYANCIKLFENSLKKKKTDYFHFSGHGLLPGALFERYDKHTKVQPGNRENYFAQLQEVMKNENGCIKDIRFILPACWKECLDDLRKKRQSVIDVNDNRWDEIVESHKDLFTLNAGQLKNLKLGLTDKNSDFLNHIYISNSQEMIFAMPMNAISSKILDEQTIDGAQKQSIFKRFQKKINSKENKLPGVIIGLRTKNAETINVFYERFMKHWKFLEDLGKREGDKNLLIFSGRTKIEDYQNLRLNEKIKKLYKIKCEPLKKCNKKAPVRFLFKVWRDNPCNYFS